MSSEEKTRIVSNQQWKGDFDASAQDKTVVVGTGVSANDDATVIVTTGETAKTDNHPVLTLGDTNVINNRFELLGILGSGGMGVVFKSRDRRKVEANDNDPYVAIKILNDDFKSHPDSVISLQREARRSQQLSHPNIVNVHDFDREGDQVYMTMEYLQGKPLDILIKENSHKPLDEDTSHSILRDLCAAMNHAHKNNIAHSDFKPGNIFVTDSGSAKVLDFGIARAVTSGVTARESGESDNTQFDAATLGALTPGYASLEMLNGELPEVSDDVYALGCVTYILFAGQHPFGKKNAVEALKAGMKPAKIKSLSGRQWKALRKALAFKREDRYASAGEFWEDFNRHTSPVWWIVSFVIIAAATTSFWSMQQSADFDEQTTHNIEQNVKINLAKETLSSLLAATEITAEWEDNINTSFHRYENLVPQLDPQLKQYRQDIAQLYLVEAKRLRKLKQYSTAQEKLDKAEQWGTESTLLSAMQSDIDAAVKARDDELAAQLELQKKQQLLAQQQEQERLQQEQLRLDKEKRLQEIKRREAKYQTALADVEHTLKCQSGFNFTDLQQRMSRLNTLNSARYKTLLPSFGDRVASCVQRIANINPEAGKQLKLLAIDAFPNNKTIKAIIIDPCSAVMPGGGRKSSNSCFDRLMSGSRGPKLVVVPGTNGAPKYAIGKYEVSEKQFGHFCQLTSQCQTATKQDSTLPARNISAALINAYASWLSEQSGFQYRLPTYSEWLAAAKAKGESENPNRNCTINAMGIRRGDKALLVTTGRANSWGLVNMVGNVQELTSQDSTLVAAGGRHTDRLNNCLITTKRAHSGKPDNTTGFRLVRALAH